MPCTRIPPGANDGLQYAFRSSPVVLGGCSPLPTLSTVIGKAEGHDTEWHGHITAVTVAPEYRRLSIAGNLCKLLEQISEEPYRGFFVDLYVRRSNDVAIRMYERMGYSVFRCVKDYYANLGPGMAGEEDAYGQFWFPPYPSRTQGRRVHHLPVILFSRYAQTPLARSTPEISPREWKGDYR